VRAIATLLALILAAGAAGAGLLIVLPAPSKGLGLAAIAFSEKSAYVVAAGLAAMVLALLGVGSSPRYGWAALAVLLAFVACVAGVVPLVQARTVAGARGVALDVGRYLRASIDSEGPGHPDHTVQYATVDGGRALSMDVYVPPRPTSTSSSTPTRPVLVVHGGFWAAGDRGEASLASRRLADLGLTVFDVEYRTAPQPNWRVAVADVKCAIGWIKGHASTPHWNVDPAKVALLGRSAGGHLALMAAYTAGDPELPPSCETGDTSVDAVAALYAPTDLAWAHDHPANPRAADSPARIRDFLGGAPDAVAERYRALSPVERIPARPPRTLLAHGGRDQFVRAEQMTRLADRLSARGAPVDTLFIPWGQHAFDFVVGSFSSQLLEDALMRLYGARP
jgi:acetyl esterase/lipase